MIEKLTEQRKKHKQSCIDNNDSSHEIIANFYSDPTHFIFEIIQNAEDAKAEFINFEIFNNELSIKHNGKVFDYSDIDSITTIGNSTKKDDINKIGKFGAGFKSVFAVTDIPRIHSGEFHFKIEDFIVPVEIEPIDLQDKLTNIVLPLKNEEVKEKISSKLQNLEMETLLFLNNINEIKYQTEESNGHYIKDSNIKNDIAFGKAFIISDKNGKEATQEYFVINDYVEIENKTLKISVAYMLDNGKIVSSSSSYLSVFFPTKIDTNLNFLLQAPYRTTPNRETIPFDNEQNKILTKRLSKLVAHSINTIKEEGLLNVDFLKLLPIEKLERNSFYMSIYNDVKEAMKSNSYIPTNINSSDNPDNLLLSRSKELTNLLSSKDLIQLWKKTSWIDTNITQDKTPKLRDYLIRELEIDEITFEKFARKIDVEFLQQKSDEWLIKFYGSLSEQEALFRDSYNKKGVLKYKEIIKLDNETFSSLYDGNDRIQIYKPTKEKSEFKTIKRIFLENEQSKIFFENYSITCPDKFAELKEFIYPKYKTDDIDINFDDYKKDIDKIILIYASREKEEKKKEIIDLFKDSSVVLSSNNTFKKSNDAYLPTNELKFWFENSENINFVNDKIYTNKTQKLFELIGCLKIPKKIEIISNTNTETYKEIKEYSTRQDKVIDYEIEGLNDNIYNISLEKSILLWKYLLEFAHQDSNSYWQPKFYEGKYEYFYRSPQSKKIIAQFMKLLKSTKWLYDKNNFLVDAKDIAIDELNDTYENSDEKIELLERLFEFKLDDIKKFEENHPDKAIIDKNEYEEFKKFKEQQNQIDDNLQDNDWIVKVDPDNVDINKIQIEDVDIILETEDLAYQLQTNNEQTEETKEVQHYPKKDKPKISKKTKDAIGNWGETFVNKYLSKEYPDGFIVKWLNQNGNLGKGYDFVILKDNKEILYIEVKSKVDENPELIEITGTQWEWARKLYDQNQGEKYQIYVVSNVNTANPKLRKIINPIKQWKDGKLKANPVNFEL